jgi:CRP/FNR family cyclic AMP-dependent transcriptional regulator
MIRKREGDKKYMGKKKIYQKLLNIEQVTSILSKISIFGGLTKKQLRIIFKLLQSVSYKEGERIFEAGDDSTHIYIVRSGEVKIVIDIDIEPLEIFSFTTGNCFGETALIGIQPHSATAVSVTDTELIVLSGEALLSISEHDKTLFGLLMLNIAREACRRLHKSDEILLHYVHRKT